MKKRILGAILACAMTIGLLAGCGGGGSSSGGSGGSSSSGGVSTSGGGESSGGLTASAISSSWKVTCPWAPSGVAAMVSQMAAAAAETVKIASAVRFVSSPVFTVLDV